MALETEIEQIMLERDANDIKIKDVEINVNIHKIIFSRTVV